MFICICHSVTSSQIDKLNTKDIKEIQDCTGLGTGCGTCIKYCKRYLAGKPIYSEEDYEHEQVSEDNSI